MITVPTRYLIHRSAYRSLVAAERGARLGVGFMLKSGRGVDHPMQRIGAYSLVWCLRGSGTYVEEDGREHPLRPGSCFHRFTHRAHENRIDPGSHWAEAWVALPEEVETSLREIGILDPSRPVQHPGLDLGLIQELHELLDLVETIPESQMASLLARLIDVIGRLRSRDASSDDPHRPLVEEATRRLGADPRLDLADLAADLGLSYERFRKVFRSRVGVSPGEYRIRRRIDHARSLLQQREVPIKTIASRLGYPNPFAFSAQFKLVVGESPEAYRKRH